MGSGRAYIYIKITWSKHKIFVNYKKKKKKTNRCTAARPGARASAGTVPAPEGELPGTAAGGSL